MLRLTTFGGLALTRDDVPLGGAAAQRSRLAILALLAAAGPLGVSRDKILALFWPEAEEERARHSLKQAIYAIRRELGTDDVVTGTATLCLNPAIVGSDLRDFETALAAGNLSAAVSLYGGPFLDGVFLKDAPDFERWSDEQRRRLAQAWADACESLARQEEARGEWGNAVFHWRKLAAAAPLSGRVALATMRALAESGDVSAAMQHYRVHEVMLREELDAQPESEVLALAAALRSGAWVRSAVPARAGAASRPVETIEPPGASAYAPPPTGSESTSAVGTETARASGSPPREPAAPAMDRAPFAHANGAVPVPDARPRRRLARRAVAAMALAPVGAMALWFATPVTTRSTMMTIVTRDEARLENKAVVYPFENQTGDPAIDAVGEWASEALANHLPDRGLPTVEGLALRHNIELVNATPGFVRWIGDRAAREIQVARESRARHLITASIFTKGPSLYSIQMVVWDAATGERRTRKEFTLPYDPHDQDSFVHGLVDSTAAIYAAAMNVGSAAQTISGRIPATPQAGRLANDGVEAFLLNPKDTSRAFELLDASLREDPTYLSPLLFKSYIYDVKQQWRQVDSLVKLLAPKRDSLHHAERTALEMMAADIAGRPGDRLRASRELRRLKPTSNYSILVAMSALYAGRAAEADSVLRAEDPFRGASNLTDPTYWAWRALAEHHRGRFRDEAVSARQANNRRYGEKHISYYTELRVLATRGDDEAVDQWLSRRIPQMENQAAEIAEWQELMLFAAREMRSHGHGGWRRFLMEVVRDARIEGSGADAATRRRVSHAWYENGELERARTGYERLVRDDPQDIESLGRLVTASIRLKQPDRARDAEARLAAVQLAYPLGKPTLVQARIAAVRGDTVRAVSLIGEAVRQGHRLYDMFNLTVHLDPDFEAVRRTQRFKDLLAALEDEQLP